MYNLLLTVNKISSHDNTLLSYNKYPTNEIIRQVLKEACEHMNEINRKVLSSTLLEDFNSRYNHQSDKEGRVYTFKNNDGFIPYTCRSLTISVYIYPIKYQIIQ